jgi:hypothetical protein
VQFFCAVIFEIWSSRPLTHEKSRNMYTPSEWPTISCCRARLELLMRQRRSWFNYHLKH